MRLGTIHLEQPRQDIKGGIALPVKDDKEQFFPYSFSRPVTKVGFRPPPS